MSRPNKARLSPLSTREALKNIELSASAVPRLTRLRVVLTFDKKPGSLLSTSDKVRQTGNAVSNRYEEEHCDPCG